MATRNTLQPLRSNSTSTSEWKSVLIESFEGFNASQVSQYHMEKARECIKNGGSRQERYTLIPFEKILNDNQRLGRSDYLTSMTSALDLLLKFVINLLKPNRPPVWRSIKTNNTAFRARVACMKGYEDVLRLMGYTEVEQNSLQFPEHVLEPDKPKLYVVVAELLMAKLEMDQLSTTNRQQPISEATHQSSYRHTESDQMTTGSTASGNQEKRQLQLQSYDSQQFSTQQCTTGTVANQRQQQEAIHNWDRTTTPIRGGQVGYQSQYQGYRGQQNINTQQHSNVATQDERYQPQLADHSLVNLLNKPSDWEEGPGSSGIKPAGSSVTDRYAVRKSSPVEVAYGRQHPKPQPHLALNIDDIPRLSPHQHGPTSSRQHPKPEPHVALNIDDIPRLLPYQHGPTSNTLSSTPSPYISASTMLNPTTVTSTISSTATSATASTIVVEDTPDKSVSVASPANEHESALENLRQKRLALKQQYDQSWRNTGDVYHLTTSNTLTETKTKAISSHASALPPEVVHPLYSDEGSSSQHTSDVPGSVFCPGCHCKVLLGLKKCNYCNFPMYSMSKTVIHAESGGIKHCDSSADPNQSMGTVDSLPFQQVNVAASSRSQSYQGMQDSYSHSAHLPKSRPRDSSFSELNVHSKEFTLRSTGVDNYSTPVCSESPSKQYHSESGNGSHLSPGIEGVPSQASAATSSSGATGLSTLPGKTGLAQYSYKMEKFRQHLHSQGKTDAEIDANPEYLMMKEEEKRKQQARQNLKILSHKVDASELKQDNVTASNTYGLENMPVVGEQRVQKDGRKQPKLVTYKGVINSEEPDDDSDSDTESVCSTVSASSSAISSNEKAKVYASFPPFITTKQLYIHFGRYGFDESEIHIQRHTNRRTGKPCGSATVIVASQPGGFISLLNDTLVLDLHKLKVEPYKIQKQRQKRTHSSKPLLELHSTSPTIPNMGLGLANPHSRRSATDPCRVFVGSGLPSYINEWHIREHFHNFVHEIVRVDTIKDKTTQKSKGYFFITFKSQASADMAVEMLHHSSIMGKHRVKVEIQRSAQPLVVESPHSAHVDLGLAIPASVPTVVVDNLNPAITNDEVKALISVPIIEIINAEADPQRRYMQFPSHHDAVTARNELDGKNFLGKVVQAAVQEEAHPPKLIDTSSYHCHQSNLQQPAQPPIEHPFALSQANYLQQYGYAFTPGKQLQQRRESKSDEGIKLLQLQPEQWNQLMTVQPSGRNLYQEIVSPFGTNPNVTIESLADNFAIKISGIPAAVSSAYEHVQHQMNKDIQIPDRIKMEALVELFPRLPGEIFSKYGVTVTGFNTESSAIHFEGTSSFAKVGAWTDVNNLISSATITQINVNFPLALLTSLRKCFLNCNIPTYVKICEMIGLTNQVILCSFNTCKHDKAVEIICGGPVEVMVNISQSDIEMLANDQCIKGIEEEMLVSINMIRQTNDERTKVVISGFCQDDVQGAQKRLISELTERKNMHKFKREEVMYLYYQHQTSPDLFSGIPIEFRKGNPAQIYVSPEAIDEIISGPILAGLRWKRYQFDCYPKYQQQIIRTVLRPLKEKNKFEFIYLIDKSPLDTKKGSMHSKQSSQHEAEHRRFDIVVYSKDSTTFLQVCASLDDIKPMSKHYSFRYRESVQCVRSIKSKLESTYLVHISEKDRGARISGLKPDDVQKCWEDIDEEIKSTVVISKTISFTKHESMYLKEKHSEDLKLQFSCDIFYGRDYGTLRAKGKLKDVEALESKISEILGSGVHSEMFAISCNSGHFPMWNKWWNDVKKKHEGSQIIIKFVVRKDKRHSGSGSSSKTETVTDVEFYVTGTDKDQILEVKEALCNQEVEKGTVEVPAAGATALLTAKKQGRLNFVDKLALTIFIDKRANQVELTSPQGLSGDLDIAEQEIQKFVGNHASVQRILTSDEPVVGLILRSKNRSVPYLTAANTIAKDHKVSVHVSRAPLVGLQLTGNVAVIDKVKTIINAQVLKKIEAIVDQVQLVVSQKQSSLLATAEFSRFESKLKEDYCVICSYPKLREQNKAIHTGMIQPSSSVHPIQLDICRGDIIQEKIDAIVNVANEDLQHTEGLAKAIVAAGGPDIQAQSNMHVQVNGRLFPGACVVLGAGTLSCKRVIHAVGPRWVDGSKGEEQILYLTVYSCLQCADQENLDSIAFPAIGTCTFLQVPADVCARVSLQAVQDYFREYPNSTVNFVRFILSAPSSFQSFSSHFETLRLPSPSKPTSNIHSKQVQGSARWLWANDSGSFSAYPPEIITQLNREYQRNPQGSPVCMINKQPYIIDFATMTQINISTGHKRDVRIESSSLSDQIVHWEYANDQGSWSPYQPRESQMIEAKYEMHSPICTLNILGQVYQLDFNDMCQINIKTRNKRRIRRIVSTAGASAHGTTVQQFSSYNSRLTEDLTVLLRGPGDCLSQAKQNFEEKLKSMFKSHSVAFPAALERKLRQIIQKHNVISSVENVTRGGRKKPQKVFVIEGLVSNVDRAIAAIQEAIIQNQLDSEEDDTAEFPPEWEQQTKTTQVFQLQQRTPEWNRVMLTFQKTMPNSTIIQIVRIQNKWQWGKYVFQKKRLGVKNNGMVKELELFHGTRSIDPKVIYQNEDGFDMRYSAQGMWGQANYFAVNASYSQGYAHPTPDGAREMFLVKVLTGDSFDSPPDSSLRKPPMKATSASGDVSFAQVQYDTVTGVTGGSRVYMTYDNDKAYPAYLIKYR